MRKKQKLKKQEPKEEKNDFEDCVLIAYQKKNEMDGWQKIEIPYKKKKNTR